MIEDLRVSGGVWGWESGSLQAMENLESHIDTKE